MSDPDDNARHTARALEIIRQLQGSAQPTAYVPSPDTVIEKALDRLAMRSGDRFIDLGCGDGRVLIAAARRGLDATGAEADTQLATYAAARVARVGPGRARVALGSFTNEATLKLLGVPQARGVYLFLQPWSLDQVMPRLYADLPAGAHVASYAYRPKLFRWRPMAAIEVEGFEDSQPTRSLYIWQAPGPARAAPEPKAAGRVKKVVGKKGGYGRGGGGFGGGYGPR